MTCPKKDTCLNYNIKCASCGANSDIYNHYPLYKDRDLIEVVRCEKCRYFFDDCCNHPKNRVVHKVPDFGKHYAYVGELKVEPNHFCGYGERRLD